MNETNTQQVVTLRDIFELMVQKLLIILLVSALAVAGLFVYNKLTYRPMYQSTATLYIAGDDSYEGNTSADAYNSYSLALKVVNDCDYLLSSRSLVDQVIQDMELKMGISTLQSRISTNNPSNTRILEVTVEAEDPQLAKKIVDRLCELGENTINTAMGAEHVRLYEYGTLNAAACNRIPNSTYMIVGVAVAVVTFGLFLLVFLLDDRIRSTEQIEQVLGLSVLGDIPDYNSSHQKGKYGYYRGRGYYGRKSYYGSYVSGNHPSNKKGKA